MHLKIQKPAQQVCHVTAPVPCLFKHTTFDVSSMPDAYQ